MRGRRHAKLSVLWKTDSDENNDASTNHNEAAHDDSHGFLFNASLDLLKRNLSDWTKKEEEQSEQVEPAKTVES